jgi:hypothetical protein
MLLSPNIRTNTRGLQFWYRFGDGTTNTLDSVKKGLTQTSPAVVSGGAIPIYGLPGPAFKFPAAGKITTSQNVGNLGTIMTACCWFNPAVTTRCDLMTCWVDGGTSGDRFNLLYGLTSSKPEFFVSSGSASNTSTPSSIALTIGTWYHVAGVYDGATSKIYVNGVLGASSNVVTTLGTGTKAMLIGNNLNGDGQTNGSIANARLYDRALMPGEILAIYSEPFNRDLIALAKGAGAAPSTVVFRRTLSELGTRGGSRQVHA